MTDTHRCTAVVHPVVQRVLHHVANFMDAFRDPFSLEVLDRRWCRTKQQRGDMVREHAIDFLRHRSVEAPQSGLHVDHGNVEFYRGEGPGEGGVRIPVDQHRTGRMSVSSSSMRASMAPV